LLVLLSQANPDGFSDPPGDVAEPEATAEPVPAVNGAATSPALVTQTGDGQLVDYVEIPSAMVGKLIGKSGETIKALQFATHTKVQIDHQAGGDMKKVSIMANNKDFIAEAKSQIDKIVNSDEPVAGIGEVSKQVECPPGIVGRIIGRGGETIRALQQASMAHIVVDQNFPEGQPRVVNIKGRADAVERATKMVQELIQGEPGSAQAIIQKVQVLIGF
jgi:far upstream element-binding protein